jgi:hypothetical protein
VHASDTRAYPNLIIGVAEKGTPGLDTWSTTIKLLALTMSASEQRLGHAERSFWLQSSIERMIQQQTGGRGSGMLCLIGLAR